jgi:hypothetical protein
VKEGEDKRRRAGLVKENRFRAVSIFEQRQAVSSEKGRVSAKIAERARYMIFKISAA